MNVEKGGVFVGTVLALLFVCYDLFSFGVFMTLKLCQVYVESF